MYNPLTPWVIEAHQKELLEKAEQSRMAKVASASRPRPWERFFVRLGDILIAAGTRLHQRFERGPSFDTKGLRSHC